MYKAESQSYVVEINGAGVIEIKINMPPTIEQHDDKYTRNTPCSIVLLQINCISITHVESMSIKFLGIASSISSQIKNRVHRNPSICMIKIYALYTRWLIINYANIRVNRVCQSVGRLVACLLHNRMVSARALSLTLSLSVVFKASYVIYQSTSILRNHTVAPYIVWFQLGV